MVRVLVSFAGAPGVEELESLARAGALAPRVFRVVPAVAAWVAAGDLPAVARAPGVVLVEEDQPLRLHLDESRTQVRADRAEHRYGVDGGGVTIAVLDSGIEPSHPDFRGRIAAAYDATVPDPLGDLLPWLELPRTPAFLPDLDGHGTHVAGIAAGAGTASAERYLGIAPRAGLASVKVFNETREGSSSDAIRGIEWVVAHRDAYGIRVMVMSFGGRPTDGTDALSRAVDAAAEEGILSVVSAGNDGPAPGSVTMPGTAVSALTVGAVDKRGALAASSGRGPTPDGRPKPDLVAPGVAITSAGAGPASAGTLYVARSGTSMAAPHVAGAAALLFEANGALTPSEAKRLLVASAAPAGPSAGAWDPGYGHGALDAEAALASVLGSPAGEDLVPGRADRPTADAGAPFSDVPGLPASAAGFAGLAWLPAAAVLGAVFAVGFAAGARRSRRRDARSPAPGDVPSRHGGPPPSVPPVPRGAAAGDASGRGRG